MPDNTAATTGTCVMGGYLVCCDDLCHGVDETLCGLTAGIDFCNGFCDPTYRDCPMCRGS